MSSALPSSAGEAGWRPARGGRAELDAVAALAALSLDHPWSPAQFAAELEVAGASLWVVRQAGEVIGYASLLRVADEVELRSLAVDPAWRRRGVARALLERAFEEEGLRNVRVIHLEVRADNGAARCLYARMGFALAGRRPRYYPDGVDALLLSRGIAPGATSREGDA